MRARVARPGQGMRQIAYRALGLACLGLASVACGGHEDGSPAAGGPAVEVRVREVRPEPIPAIHEVVGTVRPRIAAAVAAKVMATIEEVRVRAGDTVRGGDVLAILDDREMRAAFDRARADYTRFKRLLAKEAATRAEFEAVQSRYRIAEAALTYAKVVAPFDGIVVEKLCEKGDMAAPGKPLFTVEGGGGFRLETGVPERLAGNVAVGEIVRISIDATGEDCSGTVAEVVPAADPVSRSVNVKLDLGCRQPLRSGMFGRARLSMGERLGLFVPKEAVHERGQLTYLFVANESRAQMRLVRVRSVEPDVVEVLAGLRPQESVIVGAEMPVSDGTRIRVR